MRIIVFIAGFSFSSILLFGQSSKLDTMIYNSKKCSYCPITTDTVIYKLLRCGLYLGSNGDLAYRSEEMFNENIDFRTIYITWVFGANKEDSVNSGLKEMKYVIDTTSFQFLSVLYWADKNNIYGFNPMSDGGTVYLSDVADRKTFKVIDGAGYAKDKSNVYYRGIIIEGADLKTFRSIKHEEIPELACDKFYIYETGKRLTEKEIKEYSLEKFRQH